MASGRLRDSDLPVWWRDADAASLRGQRWTLRLTGARLVGSVLAALGGAVAFGAAPVPVSGALILFGFLLAFTAEIGSAAFGFETIWHDGRALAESAKTLAWRYAVAAEPFPGQLPEPAAGELLRARLGDIAAETAQRLVIGAGPVVTPAMKALRGEGFEHRREAYVLGRTLDQQQWYAAKARTNRNRATWARVLLLTAEVVAIGLAVGRVVGGWQDDLAGLLAALIAAGAAWVAVKQYGPLAGAYAVAASELAVQADRLRATTEDAWAAVVDNAEQAISREHTLWLAARSGRLPAA